MDVVRDGNESHTKVRDAGNDEQRAACGRDLSSSSTRTRQFWTLHRVRSALRRVLVLVALFVGAARTFAISTPAQGAIAAGGHHVLALKADGTVWSWGANDTGQLGTNDGPARAAPAPVADLSSVAAIATGYGHSLALKVDGTVWAWGDNSFAQLGDGTQINRSVPVPIAGLTNVVAVAAGRLHSLALQSDGSLWAWGADFFRQLGDGGFMTQLRPIRITMPGPVARVFASDYASAAVLADGSAWRWGNGSGPAFPSMSMPTRVADLPAATEIALGFGHLVARTTNGDVWVVGANDYGQLGVGDSDASAAPRSNGLAGVTMLAVNDSTNFALLADGSLRAWGRNIFGALGDGTKTNRFAPISMGGAGHYVAVAAGEYFGVALDDAGGVWQWGRNDAGQSGDGGSQQLAQLVQVPKLEHLLGVSLTAKSGGVLKSDGTVWTLSGDAVPGLSGIVAVAIGSAHSAALKSDGAVWTWGANESGQLGNGSSTFSATPVAVSGAAGAVAVDVGLDHTLMLKNDGSVWSWGGNNNHQLGDGTKVSRSIPILSTVAPEAVGIGSGYGYSVAIKPDGTVARWGLNGTVVMPGLSGIVGVSAGNNHALAVKSDGTVWGWGDNTYGQLGIGNAGGYYTSGVQVPGLSGIVEVAAGAMHSVARRNDGQVFAWGQNRKGALGDGSFTSRLSPVAMTPTVAARSIAAGDEVTALVKADGTLWAAGDGAVFDWDTLALRRSAIRLVGNATDADGDGLNDAWELAHFGSLSRNGAADADGDGLTDIRESLVGTDPLVADTDGDGKMDSADIAPLDYYDGVAPTLAIVAGDNQVAAPGEFTPLSLDVGVWNRAGTEPLVNAPVTFSVTAGGGKLATAIGGTLSDTLTLRSDNDGSAQAFYKHPSTPATNSTVTVTAGSAGVQFHTSTTSSAGGTENIYYDFEALEGYTVGSIQRQGPWVARAGVEITNAEAQSGAQSLVVLPPQNGEPPHSLYVLVNDPAEGQLARYFDFWIKPATEGNSSFFKTPVGANIRFDRNGSTAELIASYYTEAGDQIWASGLSIAVESAGCATEWHRITIRQDLRLGNMDVYLDGKLALIEVYHSPGGNRFDLVGNAHHPTYLDTFQVLTSNPLFDDSDQDGMNDAWEVLHGLNPGRQDRQGDPDHDSLSNIQEFALGTNPRSADTDGDGLPDDWERAHGFDPRVAESAAALATDEDNDGLPLVDEAKARSDSQMADTDGDGVDDRREVEAGWDPIHYDADVDGDGIPNDVEIANGSDPADYYNGQQPVVTALGVPGELLDGKSIAVQVTNTSGDPLVNAPVTFAADSPDHGFSPTLEGKHANARRKLRVRTDTDGVARVYVVRADELLEPLP